MKGLYPAQLAHCHRNRGLTVGHAKQIYNGLLDYFITRPDKLFIAITAPPVLDLTFAENARAFNDWLVNGWLAENGYPYRNVAVFDFHAVLTGPSNHHRILDGAVQHVTERGMNAAYYRSASDDDYPSRSGNR